MESSSGGSPGGGGPPPGGPPPGGPPPEGPPPGGPPPEGPPPGGPPPGGGGSAGGGGPPVLPGVSLGGRGRLSPVICSIKSAGGSNIDKPIRASCCLNMSTLASAAAHASRRSGLLATSEISSIHLMLSSLASSNARKGMAPRVACRSRF